MLANVARTNTPESRVNRPPFRVLRELLTRGGGLPQHGLGPALSTPNMAQNAVKPMLFYHLGSFLVPFQEPGWASFPSSASS